MLTFERVNNKRTLMSESTKTYTLGRKALNIEDVIAISRGHSEILLSKTSIKVIEKARNYLKNRVTIKQDTIYGINTGFGSLCNISISLDQIEELQLNLVRSHACGMGEEVPEEVVRIIMLLKILSLSTGHSGVRIELVNQLIKYFNHGIIPQIYKQGSLGASGDLAPLAHLGLSLIGEGRLWNGKRYVPSASVLKKKKLQPITLKAKEGLAILNGTQFSTAYAVWCLSEAKRLFHLANICTAISLDAFHCNVKPFAEVLHKIRPHEGQLLVSATIRKLLKGSKISKLKKNNVQDPYAFRCVPQVHGATLDTIRHCERIINTEINAVTDNPNVFIETDEVLSGGNFHAQPIALVLDFLAIAMAELGSISERRTYQLISGKRGLPEFLVKEAGLNSGFMIPQYTAASIVSQNKQLCTPASIDSIVSSNGQEDHVSMAANAATKAYRVIKNIEKILAVEYMTAMQALEFRKPIKSSVGIEKELVAYRKVVSQVSRDRNLSIDMHKTVKFLKQK